MIYTIVTKSQTSGRIFRYYYCMSTTHRVFLSVLLIIFAASAGFSETKVSPQATPSTVTAPTQATAKLAKFGFQLFPKPQDLPVFEVQALGKAGSAAKTLKSDSLTGTITVLNFWATWCPPCKSEMPSIQKLETAMKGTAFRIVAISVGETEKTVASFIANAGYTYPVYLDPKGTVGALFASQGIPTTYILDKNGKAIAGIVGAREYDDPELIAVFKELTK